MDRLIELIRKVLDEMKAQGKDKCRHSDATFKVVAYKCLDRSNSTSFIRIDVFPTSPSPL